MDDVDPVLQALIERCEGAEKHVVFVQPPATPDDDAARQLSALIGSEDSRVAVVGSISYGFGSLAYGSASPDATRLICEAAARALAASCWSHVLIGGTWDGPQRSFAEAFEAAGKTAFHVLPNSAAGESDLRNLLFQGGDVHGTPVQRKGSYQIAFVGNGFSRRNAILAGLCRQICIVGGGPGTHTEVTAARVAGAGLLPLVRTGGLVEGMDFGGRNLSGMVDALRTLPPPAVPLREWQLMLGEGPESGAAAEEEHEKGVTEQDGKMTAPCSFDDYLAAVEKGLRELQLPNSPATSNVWPLSGTEREWWSEFLKSEGFDAATS